MIKESTQYLYYLTQLEAGLSKLFIQGVITKKQYTKRSKKIAQFRQRLADKIFLPKMPPNFKNRDSSWTPSEEKVFKFFLKKKLNKLNKTNKDILVFFGWMTKLGQSSFFSALHNSFVLSRIRKKLGLTEKFSEKLMREKSYCVELIFSLRSVAKKFFPYALPTDDKDFLQMTYEYFKDLDDRLKILQQEKLSLIEEVNWLGQTVHLEEARLKYAKPWFLAKLKGFMA